MRFDLPVANVFESSCASVALVTQILAYIPYGISSLT